MPKTRPNGSGSFRQVRPGVYQLRVRSHQDPITRQYRQVSRNVEANNDTQAQKQLNALLAELAAERIPVTEEPFEKVLDEWLKERRTEGCEANTMKGYEQQVDYIKSKLGDIPLDRLKRDHIKNFYSELVANKRKASTIRGYRNCLSGSLKMAQEEGWIDTNVAQGIKLPKLRKAKVTVPSQAQVFDLLSAAKEHPSQEWHYYLPLAVASWCRRGELTALRWDHVDFSTGEIFIEWAVEVSKGHPVMKAPKGHTNRRLALDPESMRLLAEWHQWQMDNWPDQDRDGFLFPSTRDHSKPMHPDTFTEWFEWTRDKAGVKKVRLHDIRHYGPTQALSKGVPLPQVSYRLGHAQISTTLNMYVDFIPERDRDVATFMGELMAPPKELPA